MTPPSYYTAKLSKLKRDQMVAMLEEAYENGDLHTYPNLGNVAAMRAQLDHARQNASNRLYAARGSKPRRDFCGLTATECNAWLATLPPYDGATP